jgi:hypothetical protein
MGSVSELERKTSIYNCAFEELAAGTPPIIK